MTHSIRSGGGGLLLKSLCVSGDSPPCRSPGGSQGEGFGCTPSGASLIHGVDLGVIVRVQRDEEGFSLQGRLTLVKHLISAQDWLHVTSGTRSMHNSVQWCQERM